MANAVMKESLCEVVALGESLAVFNSPRHTALEVSAQVHATFAGAESNVAIGLARLGHATRWLSVLGDDPFGRRIFKTLRGEGVDVSHVRWSSTAPTAVMFKSRRGHAEPLVYYYRAGSAMSRASESDFAPRSWRDAKILYLTGITPALSESCLGLVQKMMSDARANGLTVWFDPNYRRKLWPKEQARKTLTELLPQVDCLLTGLAEGELLTGQTKQELIARALREHGPGHVVIKAGEDGAYAFTGTEKCFVRAIKLRQLVDPIGAGDGFVAGYLSGWLRKRSLEECLLQGNAVGAMVCQADGDWEGLPTQSELEEFLNNETECNR
jgi:2-dehydro-3-deoxygluconokinase